MPRAVLHRDSFRRLGGVVRDSRGSSPSPDARLGDLPKIIEKMTSTDVDAVLRLIAQQARAVTGASGAAIALGAGDEFFCRATAGDAAPPLRARISSDSGLTGECVRRRVTLRCDDSERDDRVDAGACRALQVRSLAVVPVRSGSELAGVIEVFCNRVSAFSDSHLAILERMAELIATVCRRAATLIVAAASEPASTERPAGRVPVQPVATSAKTSAASTLRGKELARVVSGRLLQVLGACRTQVAATPRVVGAAALFVVLVSIALLVSRGHAPKSSAAVIPPQAQVSAPVEKPAVVPAAAQISEAESVVTPKPAAALPAARHPAAREPEPQEVTVLNVVPGDRSPSLAPRAAEGEAAPEFGKISAAASAPNAVLIAPVGVPKLTPAPPPPPVSKGVVPGRLLRKVNPSYPIQAREARIAGDVVLDVTIQQNGKVGKVSVVSGHPLLAQAAVRAVKDWLYEPFRLNGEPIDAQTQIVVKFNQ